MSDDSPDLPIRDGNHEVDREGVSAAGFAVNHHMKWIFREQATDDYGVDAHIEVVSNEKLVTGQLIGLQAKSGESWFRESTDAGWTFRESHRRHLNYWLGHSLPMIIVLFNPRDQYCYWQEIDESTVRRTDKGFTVFIPNTQILDASSCELLEDLARRLGQYAVESWNRSQALLPWEANEALSRAFEEDRVGAARLAQVLADGRAEPQKTCSQLLSAPPSWLTASRQAGQLWAAVGGYANAHGSPGIAAETWVRSAETGDENAIRRRAYAGIAYWIADEVELAREHLLQARTLAVSESSPVNDLTVMLTDTGLAVVARPPGDANIVPIPESVQNADPGQLGSDAFLLNFLAENQLRAGDHDAAITLIKKAVATSDGRSPVMRLRLAEMLRRRLQTKGGFGGPDSRAARENARYALDDFRRWAGPSEQALSELIDLEILDGDLEVAIRLALPQSVGGTAYDREAAQPEIAMCGATCALVLRDEGALAWFRRVITDSQQLMLRAQQLELSGSNADPEIIRQAWKDALQASTHQRRQMICITRLAELGEWPIPLAEQLQDRGIMQHTTYQMVEAKAKAAAGGSVEEAAVTLRRLAMDDATASLEIVRFLLMHGELTQARSEWERQYKRWGDALLVELMLSSPLADDLGDTIQLLQMMGDPRLPASTRLNLRRRVVAQAAGRADWPQVVDLCEAGLAEQKDDDLVWQLTAALFQQHNAPGARATLTRFQSVPETENRTRLWAQLHLGIDLSAEDAQLAADLAEKYLHVPSLAGGLTALLHREMARQQRSDRAQNRPSSWPTELTDRINSLVTTLQGSGFGPQTASTEQLKELLNRDDRQLLQKLLQQVQAGQRPVVEFACAARRPYGQVLLQKGTGVLVAAERSPGLNEQSQQAARSALSTGRAVADLSTLYVLQLLGDDGRDLMMRLPELVITTSSASDAITSRDGIWTLTAVSGVVTLSGDELQMHTLTMAESDELRARAAALEQLVAKLPHVDTAHPGMPAQDSLDVALRRSLAFYADDVALHQAARRLGIPAFGTSDLIAVVQPSTQNDLIRRLASEQLVDLPLTPQDISQLGRDHGWDNTPALIALSRAAWWRYSPEGWLAGWSLISKAAVQDSPEALIQATRAAIQGALSAVSPGTRMQRYQQLVVSALETTWRTGKSAPHDYLGRLGQGVDPAVVPLPRHIFHALLAALGSLRVASPIDAATHLLPDVAADPQTWL